MPGKSNNTGQPVELDATIELSADEARDLTNRIKQQFDNIWPLIVEAYSRNAWGALGCKTWEKYCLFWFGSSKLRLPHHERDGVVMLLRRAGMTVREISATTGDSVGTVHSAIKRSNLNAGSTGLKPRPTEDKRCFELDQIQRQAAKLLGKVAAWERRYRFTTDIDELNTICCIGDNLSETGRLLVEMGSPTATIDPAA
jgi:hypothetical protein